VFVRVPPSAETKPCTFSKNNFFYILILIRYACKAATIWIEIKFEVESPEVGHTVNLRKVHDMPRFGGI